jgi:hypothetical protein
MAGGREGKPFSPVYAIHVKLNATRVREGKPLSPAYAIRVNFDAARVEEGKRLSPVYAIQVKLDAVRVEEGKRLSLLDADRVEKGKRGFSLYSSRSAVATGRRAARIAGSRPPIRPIAKAIPVPRASSAGVTRKAKATWLKLCQLIVAARKPLKT